MNTTNDNTDPTDIDEYHDRLIDRSLTELIGNDTAPDLSSRILSAAAASRPVLIDLATPKRYDKSRWIAAAIAVSLLVGAMLLLLPRSQDALESAGLLERQSQSHLRTSTDGIFFDDSGSQQSATVLSQESRPAVASKSIRSPAVKPESASGPETHDGEVRVSERLAQAGEKTLEQLVGRTELSTWSESPANEFADSSRPLVARVEGEAFYGAAGYGGGYDGYGRGVNGRFDRLGIETAQGTGPRLSGDQYTRIVENPFIKAEGGNAVSTFSIDVDTASYANVRQFLLGMNTLPPPDAVRIEELINYFDYDYAGPNSEDSAPFAAQVEVAGCPWKPEHRLVRIGIKGREMARDERPPSNFVFLVDVSGSMDEPNKLPLVIYALQQLARELGENDRVAIVVYASSEGLVLPSTSGSDQAAVLAALGQLRAGGSTAGGAGIQLAYKTAEDHFIQGGTNRVILCTDGDFNVGVTSTAELQRLCEQKAKDTGVFLSVLGFGRGNLNDAMMEAISNHGNGNYHYVDNRTEARRVLVEEMTGTLDTIAKDVKIQVEFNPRQVAGYRLIGYENRMLRTEDFNDDQKDAGEIGAGHTVTALYEIVPAGQPVGVPSVDSLKYQPTERLPNSVEGDSEVPGKANEAAKNNSSTAENADVSRELLTLKMRYKEPEGDASRKLEWPVLDKGQAFGAASDDFQFAAAVAGFGLVLRDSQFKGDLTLAAVLEIAQGAIGPDEQGYRAEFLELVRRAKSLRGQ